MAVDEKRTQGPSLGDDERIDIVEGPAERYQLVWTVRHHREGGAYVDDPMPLGEPMLRKELSRVILKLAGALRKAAVLEHQRDAVLELARIEKFMVETEGNFAEPDYPRHLLVEEIVELRSDRDAAELRGHALALERVGLGIALCDGLTESDKDTLARVLHGVRAEALEERVRYEGKTWPVMSEGAKLGWHHDHAGEE